MQIEDEELLGMDAQQQHDYVNSKRKLKLIEKEEMEALINDARSNSLLNSSSTNFDPIDSALARHPDLTREKAEEMARAFGYL